MGGAISATHMGLGTFDVQGLVIQAEGKVTVLHQLMKRQHSVVRLEKIQLSTPEQGVTGIRTSTMVSDTWVRSQ